MSKQLTGITNDTFTLVETKVENQFHFYRNDRGELGNVGKIPLEFYSRYLLHKVKEGEIKEVYAGEIYYEISADGKTMRLTFTEHVKPNLHIVKSQKELPEDQPRPNFIERMELFFKDYFG